MCEHDDTHVCKTTHIPAHVQMCALKDRDKSKGSDLVLVLALTRVNVFNH